MVNLMCIFWQYGHFFPDPQYENVQHIICCDSFATYAYDLEFENTVGFSRFPRFIFVMFCAVLFNIHFSRLTGFFL